MCSQEIFQTSSTIISNLIFTGIGGFIGYISALRVSDRNAQNIACSNLRKAFAPTLAKIYLTKKHGSTHDVPNIDKFFKDNLLMHAAAIEEFRPFVENKKKAEYQEAWEKYRYEVWNYGFDSNCMNPEIENPYAIYKILIHSILMFAEM